MSKIQRITLILSLIFCTILQVLPVFRSGLKYEYGIGYWGANGHDAIWHLALINNIQNPFKIPMPTFSGENLSNYHPFFDILISTIAKITGISTSLLLLQIFPLVSSILFLCLSYAVGKIITKKHFGGIVLLFLNTLSNSFGFIVSLLRHGDFNGESIFWAMQSASNQINPPFILSSIFFLYILFSLIKNKTLTLKTAIPIILIAAISPITKAYSAVPIFALLGFYTIQNIFKKDFKHLIVMSISLVLAALLFITFNKNSASIITFKPLWFVNSMMESPDRLFIPKLANMRYTLESAQKIGPKLITLQIASLLIFLVGNFGFRSVSLLIFFKKRPKYIYYLLFISTILTIIPILFIQKGTSWNTIQFMYYSLQIFNIFLAIFLTEIKSTIPAITVISLLFITNISTYKSYLGNPSPASIKNEEISALDFLKKQPKGNVLTYPYDSYQKLSYKTPIPIHAYETTSYVSAFSQKQTYVDDYMNLSNSGFDFETRLKQSKKFFEQKNKFEDRGFLVNNKIDYIYLVSEQIVNAKLNENDLFINSIFDNGWVKIYKVQR